mgnify:FL=1
MQHILKPAIENSHYSHRQLGCKIYNHAYIAPFYNWRISIGGVADDTKTAIVDSRNAEWEESFEPYENTIPKVEHKVVIFIGVIIAGFGHCFTDDLRKLWFLHTKQCRELLHSGAEIVYTTDINQALPLYARQILQYAGADISSAIHITELTQFDKIIVPDNSFYAQPYGRCYTIEYINSIAAIKNSIVSISCQIDVPEKIYLSRSKFSKRPESRSEQGEEVIEHQMNKIGYVSIIPEEYSFAEQIYLVSHCKYLATTEGSIAHIVVFCQPHCHVTLFCKARYLNFHQVALNQLANVDVTYVEAHHSLKMNKEIPWYGPFYLCVTSYFEKYLGYRVPHIPYFLRISFWKYMRIVPRLLNKVFKLLKIDIRL